MILGDVFVALYRKNDPGGVSLCHVATKASSHLALLLPCVFKGVFR